MNGPWRRRLKVWAINFVLIEAISLGALWILTSQYIHYYPVHSLHEFHRERMEKFASDGYTYDEFSWETGWQIRANGVARSSGRHYQSNEQGIRSLKVYADSAGPGVLRLAAFGDSFTHCDDVKNDETWQHFLETDFDSLEAINFGVGGYGTDQAYLRYLHKGKAFNANIVTIGFNTDNMLRNVNRYRPFFALNTKKPLVKPRYRIEGDSLVLVPNPFDSRQGYFDLIASPADVVPKLGEGDYWYSQRTGDSIFDYLATVRLIKVLRGVTLSLWFDVFPESDITSAEYFQVTERILKQFYDQAKADGAEPVIVIFPAYRDFLHYSLYEKRRSDVLVQRLTDAGYRVHDLWHLYEESGFESSAILNKNGGHYSPEANKRVARSLVDYLKTEGLMD